VLIPFDGIQSVKKNIADFVSGIKRNFTYVENVVLFINGNEVFFEESIDKY
jgi:hypothetical protein